MNERKECCQKPENLELQPNNRAELTIMVCKVCGCRHFELSVEPLQIGVQGAVL